MKTLMDSESSPSPGSFRLYETVDKLLTSFILFSYHANEVTVTDSSSSIICSSIVCNRIRDHNFIAVEHKQIHIYKICIRHKDCL